MGNEASVIVMGEVGRDASTASEGARAELALMTTRTQTALEAVRTEVSRWPLHDGDARYAAQADMVRAAEQYITALITDLRDSATFARPIERAALPAFEIDWIFRVFGAYAQDLRIAGHALADAQMAAGERIFKATQTAILRLTLYRRYVSDTAGDYSLRQMLTQRKRRRVDPMSAAARAELLARMEELRAGMRPDASAAVATLLTSLREGGRSSEHLERFRASVQPLRMDAALADCIVLLADAEDALEAADDEPPAPRPVRRARTTNTSAADVA